MATKNEHSSELSAEDRIELRFLSNHTHFLTGDISEENIKKTIQWIVYENLDDKKENQDKVLTLYVNSTGGELYQAFALIDIMNRSKYPISTIGVGSIMSSGFLIFASGTKGLRYITPNTGIMCHQFTDSMENKYHDIKAAMKETEYMNSRMLQVLRNVSGLDIRTVKSKLLGSSDAYFTAQELIDLNIADHIL